MDREKLKHYLELLYSSLNIKYCQETLDTIKDIENKLDLLKGEDDEKK